MRHLANVSSFSLDPYQIGFENEEGIESGAFWFYRKLGFRSTNRSIQTLTQNEETKIANRKGYRTKATTLRRLAEAPMILELNETYVGDWDRFQVRNIGLAVQRLMARRFGGDIERMKIGVVKSLASELHVRSAAAESKSFIDFAFVLSLVPEVSRWTNDEKELLVEIIRAKETAEESHYLRLVQKHERLRRIMIEIGSR